MQWNNVIINNKTLKKVHQIFTLFDHADLVSDLEKSLISTIYWEKRIVDPG